MPDLTFGSLFAGVGGFDLGMETASWSCGWQVEWDKHCQQILARHWPEVPRWSDVRNITGHELPPVDCITFGSPCQDLSVAGKRAGLDGDRSGLFHEAVRVIKEMRHATGNEFPRWAVWENVAGALSSNKGDDYATVLDTLADAGALVLEWAVLDARWFGVPQRRRRIFVVACFDPATAAHCPDPLLPVAPRSGWHPPRSEQKGTHFTNALTRGLGSGGPDAAHAAAGWMVPVTAGILTAGGYPGSYNGQDAYSDLLLAFDSTYGAQFVGSAVRRLTPLECERLMGWPDDHTRWRADGTEQSDSARYKQCGNGVASPVAAWIAHHLRKATNVT